MSGNQNGENVQQKKEKMCSIGETIYTWTQNKHATTYVGTYTKAFFSGEVCREIREHDEFLGRMFDEKVRLGQVTKPTDFKLKVHDGEDRKNQPNSSGSGEMHFDRP